MGKGQGARWEASRPARATGGPRRRLLGMGLGEELCLGEAIGSMGHEWEGARLAGGFGPKGRKGLSLFIP